MEHSRNKQLTSFKLCTIQSSVTKSHAVHSVQLGHESAPCPVCPAGSLPLPPGHAIPPPSQCSYETQGQSVPWY